MCKNIYRMRSSSLDMLKLILIEELTFLSKRHDTEMIFCSI